MSISIVMMWPVHDCCYTARFRLLYYSRFMRRGPRLYGEPMQEQQDAPLSISKCMLVKLAEYRLYIYCLFLACSIWPLLHDLAWPNCNAWMCFKLKVLALGNLEQRDHATPW
ncbi:hypothetical protein BCR37DRAFT_381103 [Protomyces lactucae-debilis]|uniref:Uncharacterized protein n=1 Tax=Protomyces lactucae-debilis TaxID=2754530 RepID=A0A1Y2F940_PROLT|nr:uncharacterized protein BCR37DRAFT_381103 [Protomyces lactucae-debilis]ORY80428.1 hypothetical protein BCR37DRAFT_381103 [Protomyces lactucae-debilis]